MTTKLALVACAFLTFAGLPSITGCKDEPAKSSAQPSQPTSKDPEAARAAIAAGAVVLDVRTPDEFAEAHLPAATNVPVDDLGSRLADVDKLVAGDKSKPIVVYCGSGRRAGKAKELLESAGYTHVINGGGLDDLR